MKQILIILIVIVLIVGISMQLLNTKYICEHSKDGIYWSRGTQYKCPDMWSK